MNPAFAEASFLEFRRVFKREFYSYLYGSREGELLSNDMFYAYLAGREL